jgi:hypothetical protein
MGCVDAPWPNLPMDATCVKEPIDGAHGNSPKWPLPLYNSTGPNCSGQTAGNCDADILEQPANLETLSARYAMFAETFLAKAAASEQPFLLYAAFAHMHVPQFSSDANVGRTGKGHFADALAELDDTVGSIITSLETHGLRKSTLVFVTGDNGCVALRSHPCATAWVAPPYPPSFCETHPIHSATLFSHFFFFGGGGIYSQTVGGEVQPDGEQGPLPRHVAGDGRWRKLGQDHVVGGGAPHNRSRLVAWNDRRRASVGRHHINPGLLCHTCFTRRGPASDRSCIRRR